MARYEIVVKNETGTSENPIAGSDTQAESTSDKGITVTDMAKGYGVVKKFVEPFVSQLVTAHTSTVTLRTGAEELQDRLQFAQSAMKTAADIVESVAIGAMIGNIPGAIAGLGLGLLTNLTSLALKNRELELQRSVENVSLYNLAVRAGGSVASYSGSRDINQ